MTNLSKHRVDFASTRLVFNGRPVVTALSQVVIAFVIEDRYLTTGTIDNQLVTVVWTPQGESIRIISGRRAWHAERRTYRGSHG
ncbi:MAG: BrnT family toxin [Chloroflexia bacterium]|nr:BrnT family toxin [Chloroflexia bacterium]MDQ3513105.1 BrnT family toxin [Chloroflexota bacterium]